MPPVRQDSGPGKHARRADSGYNSPLSSVKGQRSGPDAGKCLRLNMGLFPGNESLSRRNCWRFYGSRLYTEREVAIVEASSSGLFMPGQGWAASLLEESRGKDGRGFSKT